jgi:DNA transposition AAA+ family ATPase
MNTQALKQHVSAWITRLGSQNKVADKVGISKTALSTYMAGKYGAETGDLERKIATALEYKETGWQVVTTINNYRKIEVVLRSCKEQSMWMAISNKAGSGKTQTLKHLFDADTTGSFIFLQAEEWNAHQFLCRLADKTCGVPKRGYTTISSLLDLISTYFNQLGVEQPILVIDEADKLKPAAMRLLIPLYNRTEHKLGCLLSGTENLHKEIARGVRNNTKGYDEIDSRLGRSYIDLPGAPEKDVLAICQANNIDTETAQSIWCEVDKVKKSTKVRNAKGETKEKMVFFCEDLRRLMRLIKREQLKLSNIINE